MEKVLGEEDVWFQIFSWLGDLRESVRAWIAFGLRHNVSRSSVLWDRLLEEHCQSHGQNLSWLMGRLASPIAPQHGLQAVARLYVWKKCSRSGCLQRFRELDNRAGVCSFHPGRLKGSKLTCCRASSFRAAGCKTTWHDGDVYEMVYRRREVDDNEVEDVKDKEKDTKLPKIQLKSPISAATASATASSPKEAARPDALRLPSLR